MADVGQAKTSVGAAMAATVGGVAANAIIAGFAAAQAETEGEKQQQTSYVVHGAQVACFSAEKDQETGYEKCNCSRAGRLIVPLSHGVYLKKKAQLNKKDCIPIVNVQSCGVCSAGMKKYEEEKQNTKKGFFQSVIELFFVSEEEKAKKKQAIEEAVALCEPEIYDLEKGWQDTKPDVFIEGEEALLNISYLICAKGGIIRIIHDGQGEAELVEFQSFEEPASAEEAPAEEEPVAEASADEASSIESKVKGFIDDIFNTITSLDINDIEEKVFDFISPIVSPLLGFTYNKGEDYYYTGEHSIQRKGGFLDYYDDLGPLLGMDLETEVTTFIYDDKEYRVQLWKGSYGATNAFGGEIGIYYRDAEDAISKPYVEGDPSSKSIWYKCVEVEDELPMQQKIYDKSTENLLISNNTKDYAENGDHYWNLAIKTEQGYTAEDLYIEGRIEISDKSFGQALYNALDSKDNITADIDDNGKYVSYMWGK